MNLSEIFMIALGLAMDAVAVSIASGIILKRPRWTQAAKIAGFFGGFQTFMPVLGWGAGIRFRDLITNVDHWIAFALLAVIGAKMIYEAKTQNPEENQSNPLDNHVLLLLAIATSIDALAVGVGFAFLQIPILVAVLAIGVVTFILSFLAVLLGKQLGVLWEKRIRVLGGLILVGIGLKILIEHLISK